MSIYQQLQKNSGKKQPRQDVRKLDLRKKDTSVRPLTDDFLLTNEGKAMVNLQKLGFTRITMYDLFALSRFSDTLQVIFSAIARETFRNGYDIQPKEHVSEGDQEQKGIIERWKKNANENGQNLTEVLTEFVKDLDWADDAFLLMLKDYHFSEDNRIIGSTPTEVIRLNPLTVELVLDDKKRLGYTTEGEKAYVSLNNRREITTNEFDPHTGLQNVRACYGVTIGDGKKLYYSKDEILHKSFHNPSATYGWSPLFSLYNKVTILIAQDYYIKQWYTQDKPTKGFLVFNTNNTESLMKTLDDIEAQKKLKPHKIFPIPFQNTDGRDPVKFVDMSRSLNEMQYTETRNELRNAIGAKYGVSPLFQNDVSTSGGLNNEGLQVSVTNRSVEAKQDVINKSVLPFIFDQIGITTWDVMLNPSEEEDQDHELKLEKQRLENAKEKLKLGLKGRMDEEGNFNFEEGELELNEEKQDFIPFQQGKSDDFVNVETPVKVDKSKQKVEKKEKPTPVREQSKFKNSLDKQLEESLKDIDFSSRPSEEEIKQKVNEVVENLEKQLKAKSANRVKSIYQKAMKKVERQFGKKFSFDENDRRSLDALKKNPQISDAIKDFSDNMKQKAFDIISEGFEKGDVSVGNIVSNLKENMEEQNWKLRRVARTETSKISAAARKNTYDKSDRELKYFHIGPSDGRTSKMSEELKQLTKDGVSWSEYVNLVKRVTQKHNPDWSVDESAPITHPNTRHTFIARPVKEES